MVLNRWGRQLNGTGLGPMEEGDDIMLTCRVVGGKPKMIFMLCKGLHAENRTILIFIDKELLIHMFCYCSKVLRNEIGKS